MTQYLLAVHHRDGYPTPGPDDDLDEVYAAVDRFNAKLEKAGALVFAGGLVPPGEAKVADGATVTDGPFSEAKEVLGGFWVIEAASLDEALDLAREGSVACANPVEVRAFQSG
ncbi:YciI family protein [Intrasporangium sp. DVR]|uniref:YciI family protein n=1 Tax=Intrasporangium sp. DVR TaxID=3127867 RepID=UPI00313A5C7A